MNKKLQQDELQADLSAVNSLLASLPDNDFLGRVSFEARKQDIEAQLETLDQAEETLASVALFFDGEPVKNTTSIDAKFASTAISDFQELISKSMALHNRGGLAQKGPVPDDSHTRLRITSLVHGSFGFLLEEDADEPAMFDTPLKVAVDDVSNVLAACMGQEEQPFEDALETMDGRFFGALKSFFATLQRGNSFFRVVHNNGELKTNFANVEKAYERVHLATITEREVTVDAFLVGVLPNSRQFEIRVVDTGEIIKGKVGPNLSTEYLRRIEGEEADDPNGRTWRARLTKKTTTTKEGREKDLYTLINLP